MCLAYKALITKLRSRIISSLLRAPGIYVGPGCALRGTSFIKFGSDIYVHGHLWLEAVVTYQSQRFAPQIYIGDRVSFSEGVHISSIEKIVIGNDVLFGSHVYVSDHNHGIYKGDAQSHPDESPSKRALGGGGSVQFGENAWIGDNAVIVGPVTIGRGAVVGANAVVRADVPAFTMVGGVPAKPLRRFDTKKRQWVKVGVKEQTAPSVLPFESSQGNAD